MPERPVVTFDADPRRRRAAVLFRVPLALPALLLLAVASLPAAVAVAVAWAFALLTAIVPRPLHRVLAIYLRYAVRVSAWTSIATRRYPRVRGDAPPVLDVLREPQPRVSVVLRPLLALPSLVLSGVFAAVLLAAAIAAWLVTLARGRTAEGIRELEAFCIRYHAETLAFAFLLTARAPRLEPPTPAP